MEYKFGDETTSDIIIQLISKDGTEKFINSHSFILTQKSKYFSDRLTQTSLEPNSSIPVQCTGPESDHYVNLIKLLYLPESSIIDSFDSVQSTLGLLRAAISLKCELIIQNCIKYLEAVPWDEREEGEIVNLAQTLGPIAEPVLARIRPASSDSVKSVFISAIRFATSLEIMVLPFSDELKTSAQEQVEYLLLEDEDLNLVLMDEDLKVEARNGVRKLFENFKSGLKLLESEFADSPELAEQRILIALNDLEWICNVVAKIEMMADFISNWAQISDFALATVRTERYKSRLWGVKLKIIELTAKALDAIGYGSVVLPTPIRVQFLNTWVPYIREMKLLLDSKSEESENFSYKMESELCENIEGAIVSLILALPSSDQADILLDWMNGVSDNKFKFPDLSEAFEVWCYRTKSAKRRLGLELNGIENHTLSL